MKHIYRALPFCGAALLLGLAAACGPAPQMQPHAGDEAEPEAAAGPHGGRLLTDGDFAVELAIYEAGVPPEFHAWAFAAGEELPAGTVSLSVELARLGGARERIEFAPAGDHLRGDQTVREPHSFDVAVIARHAGREHRWEYASYEGRTTIAAEVARAAGLATAVAGPGVIEERVRLYGAIAADPTRVREVAARFPGVIRSVARQVADRVQLGDALATVEANESLRSYTVSAPIDGVITARHAEPGEQTSAEPLFEIADFSRVWAELDVFASDRPRLAPGHEAVVTGAGGREAHGVIDYVAPAADRQSQSSKARVVLDNAEGRWMPGEFVEAEVTLSATSVPLAVPVRALQAFRDFTVVFAQIGETYEVRMLTLGRRGGDHVEVLAGLEPGTVYVTDNSYLIKADIEKSGASHDH